MPDPKPLFAHVCEHCNQTFRSTRRAHRFCTYACNKRYQGRKQYAAGYRRTIRTQCRCCGSSFTTDRTVNGRVFCSAACAFPNRAPRTCTYCMSEFTSSPSSDGFCEEKCREARRAERMEDRRRRDIETRRLRRWTQAQKAVERAARGNSRRLLFVAGHCTVCGDYFLRGAGQGSLPKTCGSKRCTRVINAGAKALRNELLRREVFERDQWICGLCGMPTDPACPWPSPWYPTIDHIHPRSLGGSDDKSNLQCAHHRCNTLKGATVGVAA